MFSSDTVLQYSCCLIKFVNWLVISLELLYLPLAFLLGSIIPFPPSLQGRAKIFLNSTDIGKPSNKVGISFSSIIFSTEDMEQLMHLIVCIESENLCLCPDVNAALQQLAAVSFQFLIIFVNSSHHFETSSFM